MAGVRFPNLTAGLQQLGSQLDGVADKARRTMGVIGEARGTVDGMGSSLDALDAKTEATVARQSKFREEIEQSRATVDAFDQIQAAVQERGNVWGQELQLQMELVRLGGQSLEEFLTEFGDAQILLEDGMHTIRELFSGTDFNAYTRQIQDLIDGVREGGTDLAEVFEFLNKNAQVLGKGLAEAVSKFKQGQITLEQLARLLEQYKQDFQGDPLADLADGLLQGLLSGDLT